MTHSQMLEKVESGVSMAYNVILYQKVAENAQILKIPKFAM